MVRQSIRPAPEPHAALVALIERPSPFLIECNLVDESRLGRYSFAGSDPAAICKDGDAPALGSLSTGAAGYILRRPTGERLGVPAIGFRVYDRIVTWDHDREDTFIASLDPAAAMQASRMQDALSDAVVPPAGPPRPQSPLRSDLGRDGFIHAANHAIEAGRSEVAQHFEVRSAEDPLAVYLRFRKTLSAPVTAFFGGPEGDVLVSSADQSGTLPSADEPAFGVLSADVGWILSPVGHLLIHRDGLYRFRAAVSIDRRSDPADAYARSMAEARPLAAVLGFRL